MPLPLIDFLVLDTETTGFVPKVHRVIEFASVRVQHGKHTNTYEQLFSIPESIPPHVQALTAIRDEDLVGKPPFIDVLSTLEHLITPETIIVGQNIAFDIGMLRGEGFDLSAHPRIDTAMLASIVFPELPSYSLGYVSRALSLDHEPQHRALGDVHATLGLLEKCWERLTLLSSHERDVVLSLSRRGPAGYRTLFQALPLTQKRLSAPWLKAKKVTPQSSFTPAEKNIVAPQERNVMLLEDTLSKGTLGIMMATMQHHTGASLLSVKNIDACMRSGIVPNDARAVFPPEAILNPEAAATLLSRESFKDDELTLAIKLALYTPSRKNELPLHGEEYAIWNGTLACSAESPEYTQQFTHPPSLMVADHQHTLGLIHRSEPLIQAGTRVTIDDASLLEDAATHAYGCTVSIDHLRAAAQGNDALTNALDILELWMEKTRAGSDVRHIVHADLRSADAQGVCRRIDEFLSSAAIPIRTEAALRDAQFILDEENLNGRFAWIEQFQDGKKFLKSVPADIARSLTECLYHAYPTTLVIPPLPRTAFAAILPPDVHTETKRLADVAPAPEYTLPVEFADSALLDPIFNVKGKAVLLLQSKRMIEDVYVKYVDALRTRGITLLCQGMCGGQSRMQAEFAAAAAPTIVVTTPWSYESYELPPASVSLLALHCLPFDHPSHAVFSRRAERYTDPFKEYSLPRLKHRLFRILKNFSRHASPNATVRVADDRLKTKGYGPEVRAFLASLMTEVPVQGEQMRFL